MSLIKGNTAVVKKEEASLTGLVFPYAQRCYWLDIGQWERTDPDPPRGGVGSLGNAPQHIPPGRLQQQDKAGTQQHTWLWWSSAEQELPQDSRHPESRVGRRSTAGALRFPKGSEQTSHGSGDGGIEEQDWPAVPRGRNTYWCLGSFLQLSYLNIPRFSIYFRNKINDSLPQSKNDYNTKKILSNLDQLSLFSIPGKPSTNLFVFKILHTTCTVAHLQEIKYYVISTGEERNVN